MRLCFLLVLTIFLSAEANPAVVSGAGRDAKSGKDAPECTSGQTKKEGSVRCICPFGNWQCTGGFKKPDADAKSGNDYADAPECTSGQTKKIGESVTCTCYSGNWRCTGFKKPPTFHHHHTLKEPVADAKSGNDYADAPECTSGQTKKEGSVTCTCPFGNWQCNGFKECTSGQTKKKGCATCTCSPFGKWHCTGFCPVGEQRTEPGNDYSDDYLPPAAQDFANPMDPHADFANPMDPHADFANPMDPHADYANPMDEAAQGNDYKFDLKLLCETLINPAIKKICGMFKD